MANPQNIVSITGKLTRDVTVLPNSDGSRKIMVSIAVPNNFLSKDGKRESQFISLEAFVSKDKTTDGVYELMHKGDLVAILGEIRSGQYVDKKTKETVYTQSVYINNVSLLESKKVTEERQKRNAEKEGKAAPAAEAASAAAPAAEAEGSDEQLPFN